MMAELLLSKGNIKLKLVFQLSDQTIWNNLPWTKA